MVRICRIGRVDVNARDAVDLVGQEAHADDADEVIVLVEYGLLDGHHDPSLGARIEL